MAKYRKVIIPEDGTPIKIENGKLVIPDNPIIPFIEGDGNGSGDGGGAFTIWFNSVSSDRRSIGNCCMAVIDAGN